MMAQGICRSTIWRFESVKQAAGEGRRKPIDSNGIELLIQLERGKQKQRFERLSATIRAESQAGPWGEWKRKRPRDGAGENDGISAARAEENTQKSDPGPGKIMRMDGWLRTEGLCALLTELPAHAQRSLSRPDTLAWLTSSMDPPPTLFRIIATSGYTRPTSMQISSACFQLTPDQHFPGRVGTAAKQGPPRRAQHRHLRDRRRVPRRAPRQPRAGVLLPHAPRQGALHVFLDPDGASDNCDDLAKTLYSLLFAWLNEHNLSSCPNSLDQFCINFANEHLRSWTQHWLFETHVAEYTTKTLILRFVPAEQARRPRAHHGRPGAPKKTDHSMVEAFAMRWGNHSSFKSNGALDRSGFPGSTISHFNGVTYSAEGFLALNSDFGIEQPVRAGLFSARAIAVTAHPCNEDTIVAAQQPVKPMCAPSTRRKGTVRRAAPMSPSAADATIAEEDGASSAGGADEARAQGILGRMHNTEIDGGLDPRGMGMSADPYAPYPTPGQDGNAWSAAYSDPFHSGSSTAALPLVANASPFQRAGMYECDAGDADYDEHHCAAGRTRSTTRTPSILGATRRGRWTRHAGAARGGRADRGGGRHARRGGRGRGGCGCGVRRGYIASEFRSAQLGWARAGW
ncbi:hypothetical protein C8J57DRAFT_1479809 [Mycena rebaudengoi]|nr:hypothetical protein C8J57DRAFT_1479809 [Mycena rebaudengoi]